VLPLLLSENCKETTVSARRKFSAVPHTSLIALPTLLNSVYLVGIVQKMGQWSSRFWESNKRAARASSCLASTTQQVVHDWFYAWAGRFGWSWVMFLSNSKGVLRIQKLLNDLLPLYSHNIWLQTLRICFWTESMWSHNKAWKYGMWNSTTRMADHQTIKSILALRFCKSEHPAA
jgi:hypothetical protein